MIKLNFKDHLAAQDMIKIIEKKKNLSPTDAINFAINSEIHHRIKITGWADIALSQWGHGNPEREWETLDNPCLEMDLPQNKLDAVEDISKKFKTDKETSISYFLIFTVQDLGYHI